MTCRHKRLLVMACVVIALTVASVYFYFDPSDNIFPRCPFLSITGWECPGCGSQRAVHALLHGDIAAVWHLNAALFLFVPVLVVLFVAEVIGVRRAPRFYNAVNSRYVIWTTAVVIVLWWIVRNLI